MLTFSIRLLIIMLFFSGSLFSQANQPSIKKVQSPKYRIHGTKSSSNFAPQVHPGSAESESMRDDLNMDRSAEAKVSALLSQRIHFIENDGVITSPEQNLLNQMSQQLGNSSDQSYEAAFVQLKIHRNQMDAETYLKKAVSLNPSDSRLLLESAWIAERMGKMSERNQVVKQALNSGLISNVLLKQAEWISAAAGNGGIIITNGESDTYPFWTLENSRNYTVISLQFLNEPQYINSKLKSAGIQATVSANASVDEFIQVLTKSELPIILSWAIHPDILKRWSSSLYAIGPALMLSSSNVENLEMLKQFYFRKAIFDYLMSDTWVNDSFAAVMANMLPGMAVLKDSESLTEIESKKLTQLKEALSNNLKKAGVHGR